MSDLEPVYVFDKDGVLVESEPIKLALFEDMFGDEYAEHVPAIRELNRSNVGLARKDKLERVFATIIGLTGDALKDRVDTYLDRSYHFVKEALLKAPPMAGVIEFIRQSPNRKYVCSAALHAEVVDQLVALKIEDAFEEVYAFPDRKADVLTKLKETHAPHPIVFWGDTLFDYQAATKASVTFVGLQKPSHTTFDGLNVHTIKDFTDLEGLRRWIADNASA